MGSIRWVAELLVLPRRLASGAAAWPWWRAWAAHLTGLALGFVGVVTWGWAVGVGGFADLAEVLFAPATLAGLALGLVLTEASIVVAGAWNAAWGAGDERASASVAASIKKLMALTPHAAVVTLVTLLVGRLYTGHLEVSGKAYSDAHQALGVLALMGVHLYFLALLLAVLAAGRASARCRWPPGCEGCNYALVEVDPAGACPECGCDVERSLGESVRPGLWGGPLTGPLSSLRCLFAAQRYGREIRLFDHRQKIGPRIAVSLGQFIAVIVGLVVFAVVLENLRWADGVRASEVFEAALFGLVFATGLAALVLTIITGTASLSGWAAGRGLKRNLMPAAMQLAARMSGGFAWHAAAFGLYVIAMSSLEWAGVDLFELLSDAMRAAGIDIVWIRLLLIFGPHIAFLLLWTAQLARGVRAARFANV
jgi:hypothetical protein